MAFSLKPAKDRIKEFLAFNHAERRGIIVLLVLILLVESVNALLPALVSRDTADMSAFDEELELFRAALQAPDTLHAKKQLENKDREHYPKQHTYSKKAFAERPPMMIEINTADSLQLVRLYGIGPSFAGRILKYRGMLGGFFSIEQLLEVYGMDSTRYHGIMNNILVDTSLVRKIPVNEAEFKALLRHPYLDFETVKLICNYREYAGPISCDSILRKVIAYDPMYERFRHYAGY